MESPATELYFENEWASVRALCFGQGSKKIIAFHGFGQNASIFSHFATAMPEYTLISIDLFNHGNSQWRGSLHQLNKVRWQELFGAMLEAFKVDIFGLAGFSMGGRIALLCAELFPERTEALWLMAPDGVSPNTWYRIATRFRALHGIFRWVTSEKQGVFFHKVVKKAGDYGLVHKSVARLADAQMSRPELRRRVYRTWMLYRFLEPNLPVLVYELNRRKIPVEVFTGRYDKLIKPGYMARLERTLQRCKHHVIPCGHNRLPDAVADYLMHTAKS